MGFPRPRLRGELGWGSADTLVLLDWDDTCFPTLWYAEEEKNPRSSFTLPALGLD